MLGKDFPSSILQEKFSLEFQGKVEGMDFWGALWIFGSSVDFLGGTEVEMEQLPQIPREGFWKGKIST